MTLSFIRAFFVVASGVFGYYIGTIVHQAILGAQVGCLAGLVVIFIESRLKRVSVRGLSSMVFGLLLGILMAKLIVGVLKMIPLSELTLAVSEVALILIFSYLGAVMALRGKDEFNLIIPYVRFRQQDIKEGIVLVDSSAIIDGRMGDVFKTGFLSGRLVVPRFILQELQQLADSQEDLKRQKGRRALDFLKKMQTDPLMDIHIHEDDLTGDQSVDDKLVILAKLMDGSICTTDFNLNRIASLQGVKVLNIHELANAIKTEVVADQQLEIKLIKEGKESHQAVGYLEDGTMVVVTDAKPFIGEKKKVSVTSVIQTHAGKMIFAKLA